MKIFPHILARIGGDSFDILKMMAFDELSNKAQKISEFVVAQHEHRLRICFNLKEYIQNLTDTKNQNTLQNLRRDIYNERQIKTATLSSIKLLLTKDLNAELEKFLGLGREIERVKLDFEEFYNHEVIRTRVILQQIVSNENLQKGLLLSSRSLFARLQSFQKKKPSGFKNKEIQNEAALLKYITRMVTKTSPFSTFNNLSIASIQKSPCPIRIESLDHHIVSHISLNNYLFKYLKGIFIESRNIYLQLNIRVNPTLQENESHYTYLTNSNNIEAFQRIPLNPVISLVLEKVKEDSNGIRFDTLIKQILEEVEAGEDEIEKHIKELIHYGIFEFDLGISGIDPYWDIKLAQNLQGLAVNNIPHISDLINCLTKTREIAKQYSNATSGEREVLLNTAFNLIRDVCMKLHEEAGLPASERKTLDEIAYEQRTKLKSFKTDGDMESKSAENKNENRDVISDDKRTFKSVSNTFFYFKPEQIFYEDTTREANAAFNKDDIEDFLQKFDSFIGELRIFNNKLDEKEKVFDFIKKKSSSGSPIDLLAFYEEYSRAVIRKAQVAGTKINEETINKKNEVTKSGVATNEYDKPDVTVARYETYIRWNELLAECIFPMLDIEDDRVHLSLKQLQDVNAKLRIKSDHAMMPNSYGAFIQFFTENSPNGEAILKGVVNGNFGGHGKMISRFLHIFSETVTSDLRNWNNAFMTENTIFAEDCDASYFNANLHPPLLPFEIRMPGGNNSLPPNCQLPISDFQVKYLPDSDDCVLVHKPSGKSTFVFDLGFEGHGSRSQLFKLLLNFSKVDFIFPSPVLHAVNTTWKQKFSDGPNAANNKIVVSPRVVYEEKIILQRKCWLVPKELLPIRKEGESDAMYYIQIREWCYKNVIDDEVFVYVNPTKNNLGIDPKLLTKLGRDDTKPQYINFTNPLMIHLFEKILSKVPVAMKIEEMLPNSKNMTKIDGKRFVTEFLVQWYNYSDSNC